MKILIAYGTYSGSTKEAGVIVQQLLSKLGHDVTILDMRSIKYEDFEPFEAYILGTNTWFENNEEGMMNSAFISFKDSHPDKMLFKNKPVAVFALGDADQYLHFCKAADHLEEMVKEFNGTLMSPTLRINQYFSNPTARLPEIEEWTKQILKGFIG